jgi:uncharacterized membrane protein
MSSTPTTRSKLRKAAVLRRDLRWECSQIYIGIAGFVFLGYCWMKGGRVDDNGQRLDGFLAGWSLLFIYRVISMTLRRKRFRALLGDLDLE